MQVCTAVDDPKTVYIVTCALPGCVPDDPSDSMGFRLKRNAESYLREQEADQDDRDPYVWDMDAIPWREARALGWNRENLVDDELYDPDAR